MIRKSKLAFVFGNLPNPEEVDQISLLQDEYQVSIFSSDPIIGYLSQNIFTENLSLYGLPDYQDESTFLPGLEKHLENFDVVIMKERLGLYAYQVIKAKVKSKFRLIIWIDNARSFPCEDVSRIRTIREEVTNHADGFLVQSKHCEQALLMEGIAKDKIARMYPYVEARSKTKEFDAELRNDLKISLEDFLILHYSSVEWEESLYDLLLALKANLIKDPVLGVKFKLVVAGIGSYSHGLKQHSIMLGVDHLIRYVAPNRASYKQLLGSCDALFYSPMPSRDRIEADPYPYLRGMVHLVPVISSRNPSSEEFLEKHRLDFCTGSIAGLSKALRKAFSEKSLVNDIVQKNYQKISKIFTKENSHSSFVQAIAKFSYSAKNTEDLTPIDELVIEAERKVLSKQYLIAVDMIETILKKSNLPIHHQANLYRLVGDSLLKLGDANQAQLAYLKALEFDPYLAKAYIGLGTLGLTKSQYDLSIIHFQKSVALAPNDEMANLGLGFAFQGLDETDEAIKWIGRSLEINPNNMTSIYTLVKIAHEVHSFEHAEKALRKYLMNHPNDTDMIYSLGGIFYQLGKYDDVIELIDKLVVADPLDFRFQNLLKLAKRGFERHKNAI